MVGATTKTTDSRVGKMDHSSRRNALLQRMGAFLKAHRERVFAEDSGSFAERLSRHAGVAVSEETVTGMEGGDESIPIGIWMGAFHIMQIDEKMVDTCKCEAALFLAAVKTPPNIEKEIKDRLDSKKQ